MVVELHIVDQAIKIEQKEFNRSRALVGTSKHVPFNFWMVMLMGAKGYAVKEKSYSRIIKA